MPLLYFGFQIVCCSISLAFCLVTLVCCSDAFTCQTRNVTCNVGYSGGGTAACGTSGTFSILACNANSCSPTEVNNSEYAGIGSITGVTGQVSHSVASV